MLETPPDSGYDFGMSPKPNLIVPLPPAEDSARLANLDAGLADLNAGRSIPYDKVRRWLLSWGTDNELPPPECP